MGYYTYAGIENIHRWDGEKRVPISEQEHYDIIHQLREFDELFQLAFDTDGCGRDSVKWYNADELLCQFTEQHPGIMIEIFGDGDGCMDIWHAVYCNGKYELREAILPDFSFDKWGPVYAG